MKHILGAVIVSCSAAFSAVAQSAVGTAFTYQGQLSFAGSPAAGPVDLRFRLFDAPTAGSQTGAELCADNVSVVEGRFTVQLDFGAQFAGQQRFLEVLVRTDTGLGCDDVNGFSVLEPRQELTATAFSLWSQTSATLGGHDASFYSNAANLTGTLPSSVLSGVSGAGLVGVNAATFGGSAPAAFAQLGSSNAFAGSATTFSGTVGVGPTTSDSRFAVAARYDISTLIVDQSQSDADAPFSGEVLHQSFTAGMSGLLYDLGIGTFMADTRSLAIRLLDGDGSGPVIAATNQSFDAGWGMGRVAFAQLPALVAGHVYTIEIEGLDDDSHSVICKTYSDYTRGSSNAGSDVGYEADFWFETRVVQPLLGDVFRVTDGGQTIVSGTLTASSYQGNGAGLSSVNAATVGGVAGTSIARLDANNTFGSYINNFSAGLGIAVATPFERFEIGSEYDPATRVLDQSQLSTTGGTWFAGSIWQSFTPTVSGVLVEVEIGLGQPGTTHTAPGSVAIVRGNGSGPTLATQSVTFTKPTDGLLQRFPLRTPVSVTAGQTYTMIFSYNESISNNAVYPTRWSTVNPYAGGESSAGWGTDFMFKAYVATGGSGTAMRVTAGGDCQIRGTVSAAAFSGSGSGLSSVNAALLNGQSASYYTNAANLTGTLPSAALTGVNGSGLASVNAAQLGGHASSYFTTASNLTGTLPSATLTGVNGSGLTNVNASHLGGQLPAYYTNAANLTGTLPSATLAAVNGSGLTGVNAAQLGGQLPAYYTNAGNLTGTLADARLSSNIPKLNAANVFTATGDTIFSGDIGIGVAAATAGVDIDRGATNNTAIHLTSSGAGWGSGIRFQNTNAGALREYGLYTSSTGTFVLSDNNVSASRMIVQSTGAITFPGTIAKGGGSFKIDHPLDPTNKYLYHSFVESPDMMNIYNGVVTTDSSGFAAVTMPGWFDALNRDFRYQLTVIDDSPDEFVLAKVLHEMNANRFEIKTNRPNTKVSWQVTGIRKDAFANANRIPTEVEKTATEKGKYLHPEAFGQPAASGVYAVPALKAQ